MSERDPRPDGAADGPAVDLQRLVEDDHLLDLLSAGEKPDGGADDLVALLAAWRSDVVTGLPTVRPAAPAPSALSGAEAGSPPAQVSASAGRGRRSRPGRRSRSVVLAAAAAAAVVGVAGTVAAASDARPGSPLWPITRVLFADQAHSVVAEQDARQAIEQAQHAINVNNYEDAQRLLDEASARVGEVRDPSVVQVLRGEIAAVQSLLTGLLGGPSPAPGATGGATGGTAQPSSQPTGSQPSADTPGASQQPCIVPTGIVPTGLLPTGLLPTGILPSGLIC